MDHLYYYFGNIEHIIFRSVLCILFISNALRYLMGEFRGGEQKANRGILIVVTDHGQRRSDVLTRAELAELQQKLSTMSTTAVQDRYYAAYYKCRFESGKVPEARFMQELVQTWKEMRRWKLTDTTPPYEVTQKKVEGV